MINRLMTMVFGSKHERDIKRIRPLVQMINDFEQTMKAMSDEDLSMQTEKLKKRLADGESDMDILPEAFATVREAAWRTMGLRHFDVQMIGGIVLHEGKIAEMKTGEGKTLTSTLPIYLNALSGNGVHVVTVNDYLARRDATWMKPIYDFLRVTVGVIQSNMPPDDRIDAYKADITYGTNNEFGFDYLRDNMVADQAFRVQREHNYAIVDEVDSILIDEARTPLIISGPTEENTARYAEIDKAVRKLIREEEQAPEPPPKIVEPGKEEPHVNFGWYYDVDEKSRNVTLTEEGVKKMEEILGVENLFDMENTDLVAHTSQALRAHLIFENEVDYVVRDGDVVIIDEHTGRMMEGRRYSDGLHQALEAKEGVEVKRESQTLASITFQNYFRIYNKLAGMTGTADTEAEEFGKIYSLDVVVIPTNVPVQRTDYKDRVYRTEKEKFNAIVEELRDCIERGQPVLVGTVSIEKSEMLSELLKKNKVPHNVLNAKHHEKEADIVRNAGKPGAVTVATNMAGRGTDIVLGGYPLYVDDLEKFEPKCLRSERFRDAMIKKQFDAAKEEILAIQNTNLQKFAREIHDRAMIWVQSHEDVKQAGGLHILGTERHEARRIDNQLRGRAGRQGDPGSSRFYLSLEDNLMRLFGGHRYMGIMEKLGMEEGQELEAGMVDKAIARSQKRVEAHNFSIRKHLLEYDDVMNRQREFIYTERNNILGNVDVRGRILQWGEEVIEEKILEFCESHDPMRWETEGLKESLKNSMLVTIEIDPEQFQSAGDPQVALFKYIWEACEKRYHEKVAEVGEANFNYVERRIALDVIDARWKEHLYTMDHLKQGIWATSYSGKNPLVEYKLQGFQLFDAMVATLKEQITEFLFRVEIDGPVQKDEEPVRRRNLGQASHQSLDAFGSAQKQGGGQGAAGQPAGLPPSPNRQGGEPRKTQGMAVSGGGASRRKGSRKRRR